METAFPRRFQFLFGTLAGVAAILISVSAFAQDLEKTAFFPGDDVFAPLVADLKEPRFFVSIHRFDNDVRDSFTGASVGYGETFGLLRKNLDKDHAWQISLRGGLFSHFDMDTSSNNLLNTDYTIGALWTYRYKNASMRLRAYHQSSHVGDEYARNNPDLLYTATGFDYEAVDWLGAYTREKLRFYGGLHYLAQREPKDIDRWGYQGGLEYHGTKEVIPYGVLVGGVDVKGFQELHWTPAYSVKAGLNFKHLCSSDRYIQVMLEYYNGFIPFGQFYDYEMESYGLGVYFGL